MARIPTFADVGLDDPRSGTGTPQFPATSPVAEAEQQFGAGVQKAGAAVSAIGADMEDKRQKLNAANSTLGLFNEIIPLHTQMQLETDPEKLGAIKQQIGGLLQKYSQGIDDPATKASWLASHAPAVLHAVSDVDKRYTALDRERVGAGLHEQMDTAARTAAATGDPRAIDAAAGQIRDIAKYGEEYGAFKPGAGYTAQRQALGKMVQGGAAALVNNGRYDEATDLLNKHVSDIDPNTAAGLQHRIEAAKIKGLGKSVADELWSGGASTSTPPTIGGDLADRIIGAESGGRADAKNPRSSAAGLGQFIDSTWLSMVKRQAPDIAAGKSDREIIALKSDPDLSRRMTAAYAQQNKDFLANKGLPTDDGALYLAHFLGPAGAEKVLSAAPDTPMRDVVSADVLRANPNIANATAGDVRHLTARRVGATVPPGGSEQPGIQVASIAAPAGQQDFNGGTAPLPDIEAMTNRVQERADRGEIPQEAANIAISNLRSRYNRYQASQAQERAGLLSQLNNGAAMLQDGRDFAYDPAQIRHYFPKEKADEIIQQLDDAKDGGQIVLGTRTASPEQLVQQRAQLAAGLDDPNATNYAKRRRMLDLFDKTTIARDKALSTDPAGYVAQLSPGVAEKFKAIDPKNSATFADYATAALAEQERLGVPAESRTILPAGTAAQIASRIASIDPAKQNPGEALAATAQSYGAYWPQVFGDLVKAKLPGTYQVLATMDRPEQGVAASDLSRAIGLIAEKGGMSVLKKAVPDTTQKAIDQGLDTNETLSSFRESTGNQSGGERLYATVRDAAQALSYYYGFRDKSDSEAVQAAVDGILNAKYDFGRIGGTTVRVPKGTLGVVDSAADAVQRSIKPDDLGAIPGPPIYSPEQRKEIWLSAIRNGAWVNNEDDSGLVLMGSFRNGARSVVRRADGSRIEVKFTNAPALATTTRPNPFVSGQTPPADTTLQAIQ